MKRGQVIIRSGYWQGYRSGLVGAGNTEKRLFVETEADGCDPLVQEQVLGAPALQHLKNNAKLLIRRQLSQRQGLFRVVAQVLLVDTAVWPWQTGGGVC